MLMVKYVAYVVAIMLGVLLESFLAEGKTTEDSAPIEGSVSSSEEVDPVIKEVGGRQAHIQEFPYAVSIQLDGLASCTGVLVNPRYVLTSYECFNDTEESGPYSSVKSASVRVGSGYFDKEGREFKLKWIYDHPMALAGNKEEFGFVMLELETPVDGIFYGVASFPRFDSPDGERTSDLVTDEAVCSMIGFGNYYNDNVRSKYAGILHQIDVKLIKWPLCRKYGSSVSEEYELCAALPSAPRDFCINEVGAALVCNGKVYGILTKFKESCSISLDRPATFLRTDQINDFIGLVIDCADSRDCYRSFKIQSERVVE